MKLGKPTGNTPPRCKVKHGKYDAVYQAVQGLRRGEWLPVTFPTEHEAYNFRVAATTQRKLPLEARLRGSEVYVRLRREAKNGSRVKGSAK